MVKEIVPSIVRRVTYFSEDFVTKFLIKSFLIKNLLLSFVI